MHRIVWVLGFWFGFVSSAAMVDDTLQLLSDPMKPEAAWLLTKKSLQFNASAKKGGKWEVRFDKGTFEKVTGSAPEPNFAFLRMQPSKKEAGAVFLMVQNGSQRMIFAGKDQGRSWKLSGPGAAASPAPQAAEAKGGEDTIDLDKLETPAAAPAAVKPAGAAAAHAGAPAAAPAGAGPMFKFMFDFWLYNRPGVAPLTFSNIHTLALVEITPTPDLVFGFELAPTPRFFELTYKITPRLEVRGGRIWVPFDTIGLQQPHNLFGGLVNVSQFRQPGGTAFLPDIWTDLGLALKYRIMDTPRMGLDAELYVVNGFQAGATDPAGLVGTKYPNFENAGTVDNNTDKALGMRVTSRMFGILTVGASGYWGRYTDNADDSRTIVMIGLDAQVRLPTGLEFKGGYLFSQVGLLPAAGKESFRRGGTYLEGSQRLSQRFKVFVRGGTAQNDSRAVSVNDITMVGGGMIYTRMPLQLSLMYQRDLNTVAAKTTYDFAALRAMVIF